MIAPDTRGPASLTGVVAVVVLVVVIAGGVIFARLAEPSSPGRHRGTPPTPAGEPAPGGATGSEAQRALAGTRALITLERAVRTGRRDIFDRVYAAAPSADGDAATASAGVDDAATGADVFTSLARLPLSTYSMRYVDEVAHRGDTWRADVVVHWGLRRVDHRSVTSQVKVTFTEGQDRTRIEALEPARDEHAPVWLLGRLDVVHVGPALVLSMQRPLTDTVAAQARHAVRDVRHVLRGWDGGLVVVLPETTDQLEEMLDADEGAYDSIAAVTASADGSGDPTAPVRVVLNPPVFTALGPLAGQVVLSHEATHAATGATFRDMPLWLVEGFADYVALARDPVPLDVAAGQIMDEVRQDGPPEALPDEDDFSTSAHGLGASYEAAWLACRLVAEEHGQRGLLRFYRAIARDGDSDEAFTRILGTSEAAFTEDWRAYLRELAG